MGRILAVDYGQKRTGLAVTDVLHITANALETVATQSLMAFLVDYATREQVETFVVGMPKQLNNQDSENASHVKGFVKRLQAQFPETKIVLYDERFTSALAHQTMRDAGLRKKARQDKALVDKISATIILQDYLNSSM